MPDGFPPATGHRARLRWCDCVAALRARWKAYGATQRERGALRELGETLAHEGPAHGSPEELRADLAAVACHDAQLEALRAELAASLEEDRADWAGARSWMRPLVVLRGIATRCLVRDRIGRARRSRAAAHRSLGAAALDAGIEAAGPSFLAAVEARRRSTAATAALDARLATFRAAHATRFAHHAAREAAALGKPLVQELRARVLPRMPALAGLAAGWWIARTFTDSRWSATLHSLGIGSGPRRVVSTQQLHAMEFWLPIVAAAIGSYASGRIAALLRARYAPAPTEARRDADGPGAEGSARGQPPQYPSPRRPG